MAVTITTRTLARLSWRSLVAHKLRLVLTVLAVTLGTAFIAGSMLFTAQMGKSLTGITSSLFDGVDVIVSSQDPTAPLITPEQRTMLDNLPEVRATHGSTSLEVAAIMPDGTQLPSGGAPIQVMAYEGLDNGVGPQAEITTGSAPQGPNEALLNESMAARAGLAIGDTLRIVTGTEQREVTLSGLYTLDFDAGGYAGIMLEAQAGRELINGVDADQSVMLGLNEGVDLQEFITTLQAENPTLLVQDGQQLARDTTEQMTELLQFFNYFMLAFGLIALLVGTFIITNTFTMVVASRIKEFALLRAVGASRRQLTLSVLIEAFFIGLLGAGLGIIAGFGLVQGILAVMRYAGLGLPSTGLVLTSQAIYLPLIIGLVVTLLSAWFPAQRAGSTPPVQAMRSGDATSGNSLRLRSLIGAAFLLGGTTLAVYANTGLDAGLRPTMISIGVAAVVIILGLLLIMPLLSIPLVGGLGRILGAPFRAMGRLAATNSHRNPRRTAATAFALTLGLALVTIIGMLSATMNNTVKGSIENGVQSDLVASVPQTMSLPRSVLTEMEQRPDVASVGFLAAIPAASEDIYIPQAATVGSDNISEQIDLQILEGASSFSADRNELFVITTVAERHGLSVGDTVEISPFMGSMMEPVEATVTAITDRWDPGTTVLFNEHLANQLTSLGGSMSIHTGLITAVDGTDRDTLQSELTEEVADLGFVQILTPSEFATSQAQSLSQLMNFVYGLLALSVVIAILGIVNTLALSVAERTREIGMLRAVGMLRGQVRTMIILESVQIAVYGAILGVLLGLGLGWAFLTALADMGLDGIVIPWGQVAVTLCSSAVVGVLAALWPARRAAQTSPLEAIATNE